MFHIHRFVWVAALGVTLLVGSDSFAQRRGGGAPARGAAPRAAPAPRIAPAPHIAPQQRIAPTPHLQPNIKPSTGTPRSNVIQHPGMAGHPGSLQNASRFDNNHFHNGQFNHNHNSRFNDFFFWAPGLFGFWPWSGYWGGYSDYGYGQGGYYPGYDTPYYGNPYGVPGVSGGYGNVPMPPAATSGKNAQIDVFVPDPNAEVWIDDFATTSRGMTRYLDSPDLVPGAQYSYTIKARWNQNGQPVNAQVTVPVGPGAQVVVDFTQTPPRVTRVR
jgi:uncharacterized protein (TIGR03000 family)